MRRVAAAAVLCLGVVLGSMAAGAVTWATAPAGVVTSERARQDLALVTGLPAADVPLDDAGRLASAQVGPFAFPYPPADSWWAALLGADDYGARGYSAEVPTGQGWVGDAEQRLRSAGWATRVRDDDGETTLTASSPEVAGAPSRVVRLTIWQSWVRADLLRAAPPALHAALIAGAAVGGVAVGAGLWLLALRSRRRGAPSGGGPEPSVLADVSAALGTLAVGAFVLFSAASTVPVWTSPFGAAAVAPWAPLLLIGVRHVLALGVVLLVLSWLLTVSSRHRLRHTLSV